MKSPVVAPEIAVNETELRALLVGTLEILTVEEFDQFRSLARRLGTPIERILTERGRVPQTFLLEQLAGSWEVGFIDLKPTDVNPRALAMVEEDFARTNCVVAFDLAPGVIRVAACDPRNAAVFERIQRRTGWTVQPFLAPPESIQRAHLLYKAELASLVRRAAQDASVEGIADVVGEATSVETLLTRILESSVGTRASDIHIEPYERMALVRFRVDGVLREMLTLSADAHPSLVSRVKVLAGLRIDERRIPQDGRFDIQVGGLRFDFRVSTMPTEFGEKIVMRALSKSNVPFDLESLGLAVEDYELILRNLTKPFGMVLVTGPTGSGKSTTLYSMLTRLGIERKYLVNMCTVEDPVEQSLTRVSQTTIKSDAGFTFATALRALLRQDPDVIMVGEIRDRETAEIAVRASLVGRMLLSTLHTNDATGAAPRLIDMGIEPFLLSSSLSMVVGQRLVRRICTSCRGTATPDPRVLRALKSSAAFVPAVTALHRAGLIPDATGLDDLRTFRGTGCVRCQGTGYAGRVGLFEVLEMTDELRPLIMQRSDAARFRAAAIANGMRTLLQDGLAKAILGETTLDEALRVAS